jgi:hypothetical protein
LRKKQGQKNRLWHNHQLTSKKYLIMKYINSRFLKTFSVLGLLALFSLPAYSQTECPKIIFSYDNAGNRIKREYKTDCPPALVIKKNPVDVTLEPNPAGNFLHVYVKEAENTGGALKGKNVSNEINAGAGEKAFGEGRLTLINHSGHTVMQQTIYSPNVTLDVSALSNGIYYCRVVFEDGREATKRVVVLK